MLQSQLTAEQIQIHLLLDSSNAGNGNEAVGDAGLDETR